jgi:heme/copper-type cytochrome/quinol oxidase subunit 3
LILKEQGSSSLDNYNSGYSYLDLYKFGLILFIFSEIMLFGALLGSFLVYKNSPVWPPFDQPRYPANETAVNTIILLLSGATMFVFRTIYNKGGQSRKKLTVVLALTVILGVSFLILQGVEWVKLVSYGLTMTSSIYGSIFYVIVGFHAIHVLIACIWLVITSVRAIANKFPKNMVGLETCGIFWYFVVLLWPVIYSLLYF